MSKENWKENFVVWYSKSKESKSLRKFYQRKERTDRVVYSILATIYVLCGLMVAYNWYLSLLN